MTDDDKTTETEERPKSDLRAVWWPNGAGSKTARPNDAVVKIFAYGVKIVCIKRNREGAKCTSERGEDHMHMLAYCK